MLQRIQSFYLVLAVVGIIMLFKFPIAIYTFQNPMGNGDVMSELRLTNQESRYSGDTKDPMYMTYIGQDQVKLKGSIALTIIAVLVGAIALVSIFLFKNRILQMRVVACAALMNVVYLMLIFFWAINGMGGDGGYMKALTQLGYCNNCISVNMLTPGAIIPVVTLILLYLAQRAIRKDEIKVRAADRLR